MFNVLNKFFKFSGPENEKKFKASIVFSVFEAIFGAFKVPAIMYLLMGILNKEDLGKYIQGSAIILGVSLILQIAMRMKITMLQTEGGYNAASFKRIDIAKKLRYLPMGFFNEASLGNISSVATNTMEELSNVATRVVLTTTKGIIETVVIICFITAFDWRIGLISAVGMALFLLITTGMQRAAHGVSEDKVQADERLVGETVEYIQGISEVKSYNLCGEESKKINAANDRTVECNIRMEKRFVPYMFGENMVIRLLTVVVMSVCVYFYISGSMTLLYAIGMTIMSYMMFAALEAAGNFSALLHTVELCVNKANAILDLEDMDIDGKDEKPANHNLELKDVVFSYDKKRVINGVSLKIPEKTSLAIVGPSGGGKTTLTRLIARFWDVEGGEVTLGGENIKNYSMDSLMNNFSFVFQSVYLFNDTIENNIKFSNPAASHEAVVAAAKKACCHDFIEKLPNGYNTVIGEGGASLSGGEKQRISIARAIMKDAPIIILDEATANVDPENEKELTDAIHSLTKDKTVIMIAHRL
nr:ABC transporter ATP-binding protein/permease [Lachnospiraceae bacterium]